MCDARSPSKTGAPGELVPAGRLVLLVQELGAAVALSFFGSVVFAGQTN
jgi:hypothetical protein